MRPFLADHTLITQASPSQTPVGADSIAAGENSPADCVFLYQDFAMDMRLESRSGNHRWSVSRVVRSNRNTPTTIAVVNQTA
jgi:hypothetical protein